MKLVLHFDIYSLSRIVKHFKYDLKKLHNYLEELHKQLLQHDMTDFMYYGLDLVINDSYGKAALTFLVNYDGSGIALWNYKNGVGLTPDFTWKTEKDKEKLRKIIDNVSHDLTKCNDCGKWIANVSIKHYSFAGGVCPACYNPSKHLPPDTSGS